MADEPKLTPTQVKAFVEGPVWAVLKAKFRSEFDRADSEIDSAENEFDRSTAIGGRRFLKWALSFPIILEAEAKDESPMKKVVKYGKKFLEG